MDKEEAMKILKDFHDKSALFSVRTALDTIIPELRESEDERIRKHLISLVKNWDKDGIVSKYTSNANDIKQILAWLENQGEQKPTDKVEPKFHEGEWIISNDKKSTYQVIEVKRGIYVIRDNVDNHEYHIGIEECEKSGRLFTIQDAKDGDVLYSLDTYQPFIYKARNIHEQATAYCGINKYEKFFVWNTNDCIITLDKYIPATKEQRDTLLKAMSDAGYTFDFGKKELKKIEQKSQRTISAEAKEALWSDKYEGLTDFERTLADICIGWIGEELGWKQYIKDNADVLLKIAIEKFNSVQDTLFKQKTDWSEEDEKILNNLIDYIKVDDALQYSEKQVVDWLKSLKERIKL